MKYGKGKSGAAREQLCVLGGHRAGNEQRKVGGRAPPGMDVETGGGKGRDRDGRREGGTEGGWEKGMEKGRERQDFE